MKNNIFVICILCISVFSCKKDSADEIQTTPTEPFIFEELTFNRTQAYFSTDGSMSGPIDSTQAKSSASKIDITFIYDFNYGEPGFLDPVTRSQEWYWNSYENPWLSTAQATSFYSTNLTKIEFDEAKIDQSKIATYLKDTSSVILVPHGVFPSGSCIGGRKTYDPQSITLKRGQVFGFKNTISSKKGLLYIRPNQITSWPESFFGFDTKVDIIKEK